MNHGPCQVWNKLNEWTIRNKVVAQLRNKNGSAPLVDAEVQAAIEAYDNIGTYQYEGILIDLVPSGSDGEILCVGVVQKRDGFLVEVDIHCIKLLETQNVVTYPKQLVSED